MFTRSDLAIRKLMLCLSIVCIVLFNGLVIDFDIAKFKLVASASAAEIRRPFRPRHEVRPPEPRKAEVLKKSEPIKPKSEPIKPKFESPLSKEYKVVPEKKSRYDTKASKRFEAKHDALERKADRLVSKEFGVGPRNKSIDLSREFYLGRDGGYPRNEGFVMETVRSSSVKKGDVILRLGSPFGRFATRDINASASSLGLYKKADKFQRTYYRVLKDFPVIEGKAAKAFGGEGGGNQLKFARSLDFLVREKYLEKITIH